MQYIASTLANRSVDHIEMYQKLVHTWKLSICFICVSLIFCSTHFISLFEHKEADVIIRDEYKGARWIAQWLCSRTNGSLNFPIKIPCTLILNKSPEKESIKESVKEKYYRNIIWYNLSVAESSSHFIGVHSLTAEQWIESWTCVVSLVFGIGAEHSCNQNRKVYEDLLCIVTINWDIHSCNRLAKI